MPFKGLRKRPPKKKTFVAKEPMIPWLRAMLKTTIVIILVVFIVVMILARVNDDPEVDALLRAPENTVAQVITPAQDIFSQGVDLVVGYLRKLKLRSNLEMEYNRLKDEYDQLVYEAMLAEELQNKLSAYETLIDEIRLNESMQPIVATVIGRDEGTYSATMQINKGRNDGIEDFMVVTVDGALVGYTYGTTDTKASVKAVIDTDASIPALISSTRNQGTIKGTLGIDGTHMCRMYHSDDYIPRPGDKVVTSGYSMPFPKGIPIGTVRESTRGMDANKQYIVVEPLVDFYHIEYVIVYKYQPTPEAFVSRGGGTDRELIPLDTPRPKPTLQVGGNTLLGGLLDPDATEQPIETIEPVEVFEPETIDNPQGTPGPSLIFPPNLSEPTIINNIEYRDPNAEPTPTPVPTDAPTPEPTPPITVADLTIEADN